MNNPSPQQDRRMYYGYVIVIASAFIMLTGWGTYYGYGIFFEPLIKEFGWTRALASGAYSMSTMLSGLIGVFAGGISDRLGPRKVTAFCGVFFGLGLLLMSRITSAWQMYVLFALPVSIGIGGLWSPMVSTVARWFVRKRGLMTGIVASGIGLGAVIFPPVISVLISAVGWRMTYVITGAIVLVVIFVAAQFLKRDPQEGKPVVPVKKGIVASSSQPSKEFSFKEALRTKRFWTIASVYFLFGYIQVTMSVHTVVFASGLGITPITAASVLSLVGAISIIGRILIGIISDKIQIKPTLIIIVSLMFVSTVWLQFAGSLWGLYLYGIIFGFAWGGLSAMQSLVSAELFGLRALGVVVGSFSFSFCIGGTIGPVVAGHIYDVSGNYRLAFLLLAIAAFIALMSVLWLSPPRRKR